MPRRTTRFAPILAAASAIVAGSAGCLGEALEQNRRYVEQLQAQIDKQAREIQELRAQLAAAPPPPAAPPPGACDVAVMQLATTRGGESFAQADFQRALGYYQDALTACPGNARAELNVARTYEALGDRSLAIVHYRRAAQATDANDAAAAAEARDELKRLGADLPT